jgi:beta-xylosidase
MTRHILTLLAILVTPVAANVLYAANDEAKPAPIGPPPGLRKLMDTPLRDPSICRGPDDTYYLTGTSEPFWSYNNQNGIRLWKSKDLKTWEPLGTVWRYCANTMFQDTQGECWSTYFGPPADERPSILPIDFAPNGRLRPAKKRAHASST